MEAVIEELYIVHLRLEHAEVKWLKAVMQNPLFDGSPDDEPEDDKEMRKKFWNALLGVKV